MPAYFLRIAAPRYGAAMIAGFLAISQIQMVAQASPNGEHLPAFKFQQLQMAQLQRTPTAGRTQAKELRHIPPEAQRTLRSTIQDVASRQGRTSESLGFAGGRDPEPGLLDLLCGEDWFVSWVEDEDGNPVPGTHEIYCGDQSYPL